jgi:hypothetical protein
MSYQQLPEQKPDQDHLILSELARQTGGLQPPTKHSLARRRLTPLRLQGACRGGMSGGYF